MAKVCVTFEVEEEMLFPNDTLMSQRLRAILMDALFEFSAHRQPVRDYVERRYIDLPEDWREQKIRTTAQRVRIAEQMHSGVGITLVVKREE
jgi:hypothetical protein